LTRISWSDPSERRYEAGVDRGVLYPVSGHGVPWVGLISVNEAPTGGGSVPFYLDGIRFLNRPEGEEFAATIEAYTYPPEFGECDGTLQLHAGLFASHQRRKPFGLSYRTRVGTSTDPDLGYKIHLVYNAMAEPSERAHQTFSDSPEATTFSWNVSGIPVRLTGAKPTAHLVIDSTETDPIVLTALENMLYGSEDRTPGLPDPDDLLALFLTGGSTGGLTVTDNGDGTFTIVGTDDQVILLSDGQFQLSDGAVINNGDGTFTVTSS
jgi:hypothetical protein